MIEIIFNILLIIVIVFFILLSIFYLFWKFWFCRNPKRIVPKIDCIISPADGKINEIIYSNKKNIKINKGYLGKIDIFANDTAKDYVAISIVMTPFNVHFQRSPIDGKIIDINYNKGKFENAVSKKIAINNENNQILIIGKNNLKIKVIQIAGFLARRINCFVKLNQNVFKGQKIGFINLGSQVTLIMPSKYKLLVKKNDIVFGGETIIAKLK
jgi:phosphatidylserine decarboxylase